MNVKISGLTITTAVAIYAAASPAKALTLTMACEGYNVVFSPGSLMSHAPKKDRDYPITKVDVQNDRIVVTGVTKYGKITAFFSNDGHPSIVWTNGKDVVLNQCANDVAAAQPSIGTVVATTPPMAQTTTVNEPPAQPTYRPAPQPFVQCVSAGSLSIQGSADCIFRIIPAESDCVQETSLTQEGSMTDPEFQFLFTDVRAP